MKTSQTRTHGLNTKMTACEIQKEEQKNAHMFTIAEGHSGH